MGIMRLIRWLFGADASAPPDAMKLDGTTEATLARSLSPLSPDEQGWITFAEISFTSRIAGVSWLRALAVTSAARSDALPDVPAVAEFVPGFEASIWHGIGAPKNTPAAIINRLNHQINAALADPKIKERFADIGGIPLGGSPADFRTLITDKIAKWGKVIQVANINP